MPWVGPSLKEKKGKIMKKARRQSESSASENCRFAPRKKKRRRERNPDQKKEGKCGKRKKRNLDGGKGGVLMAPRQRILRRG